MEKSRRNFIRGMALTGAASIFLSGMKTLIYADSSKHKPKINNGMIILFQGDSITDGNRGRDNDLNHIMGHGYAYSVASRLGADFPEKKLVFYNRGISGNKINDLERRWQTDTIDLKPDVLSILIGVNDASSVVFRRHPVIDVEKYEEGYKSLLDKTLAAYPEVTFVLCEPFVLRVGGVSDNWEAYHTDIVKRQAIVRKLARQYNAVFVGFQEVFNKACEKAPAEYWMWDGIHPTVAGHELMAREWIKQVEKKVAF